MAQYKVTKKNEAVVYAPPGHFRCICTRHHEADDAEGGKMIIGVTYFLPGGGCEYGANPMESMYYILEGEMTLKTDTEEVILRAGDSFHCIGGTNKSVTNTGDEICRMLVVVLPPQA